MHNSCFIHQNALILSFAHERQQHQQQPNNDYSFALSFFRRDYFIWYVGVIVSFSTSSYNKYIFYANFTTFVVVVYDICGTLNSILETLFGSFFLYSNLFHYRKTKSITTPFTKKFKRNAVNKKIPKNRFECDAVEIKFKWDTWCCTIKTDCWFCAVCLERPLYTLPNSMNLLIFSFFF